jgi:chromosome segregation ATPase
MADRRANITSIEALEAFRSNLIVYLDRAGQAVDEISDEVSRTRGWLQGEQKMYWSREIKKRAQRYEMAQQALMSARLSRSGEPTEEQRRNVQSAKSAVREAEEKIARLKQWSRHFDSRVEPLAKQLGKLDNLLNGEMQKGVHWLAQASKNLREYAEMMPTPLTGSTPNNQTESDSDSDSADSENSDS